MAKGMVYVFYATLLYGEYQYTGYWAFLRDLPDGVFLYIPKEKPHWYLKDLTPVLLEDVPKPLRALVLLMGLPNE